MTTCRRLSVTISVPGRFHAFDLARQLQDRGVLQRLITSYPGFLPRRFGIDPQRTDGVPTHEILNRLSSLVRLSSGGRARFRHWLGIRYDRAAARRIPKATSLFVGWAGASLQSIDKAKQLGARTVLERGSTHIRFQDRVLREEYARLGLRFEDIHPASLDREQREYETADCISVPSRFVRDTFVKYGVKPAKLLVIPYGCNLTVFRPGKKADNVFRVIHCGQVSIRKGVHHLIRAFAELNLRDSELWLIGGLSPEIVAVLGKYAGSRITVKGPFPQASLPEYYSQGSVFCIASLEEGLAMVIPQALSCGLPVVGTENSGAGDLVREGKTGFVVPAGDVEALKQKLLLLYENAGLRDEMAATAGASENKALSWDRYGDRIAEAYRQLLNVEPGANDDCAAG